jgi:pyridinium-3,5-biscarboxylic acid mononucleotide synthase
MNSEALRKLFDQVRKKRLSPDEAVERLRHLPFEDLGFAKVDHHRALRQGMPEVIFAKAKRPAQVAGIFTRLAAHGGNVLATRATEEQYAAVTAAFAPGTTPSIVPWREPLSSSAIAKSTARE